MAIQYTIERENVKAVDMGMSSGNWYGQAVVQWVGHGVRPPPALCGSPAITCL